MPPRPALSCVPARSLVLARSLVAAALIALAACPARAEAQSDDTVTEALAEARAALRRGDPELAIDVLDEARAQVDAPALRYELYLAHHQAGQHAEAAAHLEAFLDSEPAIDEAERATLEGHLADLRARAAPRGASDPWADPAVPIIGWTLLGAGIVGLIVFVTGAAAAFSLENGLPSACRTEGICAPGARDGIDAAWTAAWIGLASGVVLGAVGGALLVVSGEHQAGASRSLPPDLDPSIQRPFSLAPWVDPARGSAGMSARVVF